MEELGEGGGASDGIRGVQLGACQPVVLIMLNDEGWQISEDERTQVCSRETCFEGADDLGCDLVDLDVEVLVKTRDLGPPRGDESPQRERDKVVDFSVQLRGEVWGIEQGRDVSIGTEVREEKTLCESGSWGDLRADAGYSFVFGEDGRLERANGMGGRGRF